MFARIVLFLVGANSVITANPLLQTIVSQTCPICEHNALKTQLQNLLFQTANNYQPYPHIYCNQNQPVQVQSDLPRKRSCPVYPQNIQNQNFQVPPYQQQALNQPYCPYTQQNEQPQGNTVISEAINRIFSNPSLKTILDPNTKLFNQEGLEIPRNGPCNNGPPQVVNNYIIVPPEFLLEDKKSATEDRQSPKERRKKNNNQNVNERRNPKPKNIVRENRGRKGAIPEEPVHDGERKQRGRLINRNPNIKVKVVNKNTSPIPHESQSTQTGETEKTMEPSEIGIANTITTENQNNSEQTTTPLPEQDRGENKTNIADLPKENYVVTIKTVKSEQTNPVDVKTTEGVKIQSQTQKETVTAKPKRKHSQSSDNSSKRVTNNSKRRKVSKVKPSRNYNPREESVIKDFKKRFPNIPEDVVRNLIDHMKRQLANQNFLPPFYYPQFPITFDQLYGNRYAPLPTIAVQPSAQKSSNNNKYQSSNNQNRNTRKRKKKTRQRKPKLTTTSPEPCAKTVELTPTVEITTMVEKEIETTTVAPTTTTEKPPLEMVTEPVQMVVISEVEEIAPVETTTPMPTEQSKLHKNTAIEETKKVVNIPELGSEDVVPTIYLNELDDEYYPDFTEDLQYYSDEDLSFFGLEDDRYHYTTDKNFPLEELNRERRRFDAHAHPNLKRQQEKHIFRLQNRDRVRPNSRPINQKTRTKFRTTRPDFEINNVTPKIKVFIKDFASKENINAKSKTAEGKTKNPISEEIEFRTPPTLEFIDFETKQINKAIFFHDDYKTSSYSDIKTPYYNFNKNNDKSTNLSHKQKYVDQIQTDYAGSKVVNYGKPVFEEKDLEKGEFENEQKTIVLAKSVNGDYW